MTEQQTPHFPEFDPKLFWKVLGMRAAGAAVVTAAQDGVPSGFFALSATHLTSNPPSMMVSISNSTSSLAVVLAAGHFAINYLTQADADLVDLFSGRAGPKGEERFEASRWETGQTGAPVLSGAVGVIECRLEEAIPRFDSTIIIGRIASYRMTEDAAPMVFFKGRPLS